MVPAVTDLREQRRDADHGVGREEEAAKIAPSGCLAKRLGDLELELGDLLHDHVQV